MMFYTVSSGGEEVPFVSTKILHGAFFLAKKPACVFPREFNQIITKSILLN